MFPRFLLPFHTSRPYCEKINTFTALVMTPTLGQTDAHSAESDHTTSEHVFWSKDDKTLTGAPITPATLKNCFHQSGRCSAMSPSSYQSSQSHCQRHVQSYLFTRLPLINHQEAALRIYNRLQALLHLLHGNNWVRILAPSTATY